MKPPRFSLRGLLILTASLAAFCYWRDRPRQVAKRFVAAVEAGDYKLAEAMLDEKASIGSTVFDLRPPPRLLRDASTKPLKWTVVENGQTFGDWLTGRYHVSLDAVDGQQVKSLSLLATSMTIKRNMRGLYRIRDASPPIK
jgi:hypothetical protein